MSCPSVLVSHYSAIGDTISCDAPYSAIGFRGMLLCDAPLVRPVFGLRQAIFKERSGGVAAIVCDTTGNTVRQGYCYTCLAIGGGISVGSLSQVSKLYIWSLGKETRNETLDNPEMILGNGLGILFMCALLVFSLLSLKLD